MDLDKRKENWRIYCKKMYHENEEYRHKRLLTNMRGYHNNCEKRKEYSRLHYQQNREEILQKHKEKKEQEKQFFLQVQKGSFTIVF